MCFVSLGRHSHFSWHIFSFLWKKNVHLCLYNQADNIPFHYTYYYSINFDFWIKLLCSKLQNYLLLCVLALRAPDGLVVSGTAGNLTVCWKIPQDGSPDGYYITSSPPFYSTPSSLWLNQSSREEHRVDQPVCIKLGRFIPGQTYEIGVASLKGKDRSKAASIQHTTGKSCEMCMALQVKLEQSNKCFGFFLL